MGLAVRIYAEPSSAVAAKARTLSPGQRPFSLSPALCISSESEPGPDFQGRPSPVPPCRRRRWWSVPRADEALAYSAWVHFDPAVDYFDRIELVVELVPGLGEPPIEVWVYQFDPPPEETADWPTADLRHVLLDDLVPHTLDDRRRYADWGASGASHILTLALLWAGGTVVGNAAWTAVTAVINDIRNRLASSGSFHTPALLSQDDAKMQARWQLGASHFDIDEHETDLVLASDLRPAEAPRSTRAGMAGV